MSMQARIAAAAVVGVLALGGALFVFRPGDSSVGGPSPTPSPSPATSPAPSPSPMTLMEGAEIRTLVPGTYVSTPFSEPGSDWCFDTPAPFPSIDPSGCTDTKSDDSISFTFAVPAGWARVGNGVWLETETSLSPGGASLLFGRGAWLHADPCLTDAQAQKDGAPPDIEVGPTVDDFANAIADHPLLDATAPVDVTLDGYSGKYMELQMPADLSGCQTYYPWEPWHLRSGPSNVWNLWILDVDGVRVAVQTAGYATTSAQHQAELQAIVDSIQIQP